jgi:hypothetical protein
MTANQIRDALRDIPCTHEALGLLLAKAERMAGGMDDTGQWDRMHKVHEEILDAIIQLEDTYAAQEMK